jgi:hypothetical protein
MKKILIALLCLLAVSCARSSPDRDGITFNVVQPLGQKSVYAVKNDLVMETAAPEMAGGPDTAEGVLTAVMETEVTARKPDGTWTLSNKFANIEMKIDGETHEETSRRLEGKSFAVMLDKQGNIVGVVGVEALVPGMDFKQMLTQMTPSMMLPQKPIKVGESWPIELSNPAEIAGATANQTLKGTGTLKEVNGPLALMDFVYKVEMSVSGEGAQQAMFSGEGEGKSTVSYDLEKARFTSNTTQMTMRTVGQFRSAGAIQEIKNTLKSSLQVDLVNK